jgi:uncharacterized protein YggT (Ycf19 family)
MGAADASLDLLLYDAVDRIQQFVAIFIWIYMILVFAYVLTSWIRLPYSLNWLQRFLHDVVEPYLRIFRRFVPPLGPLDISPLAALAVLILLRYVLVDVILESLH